MFFFGGPKIKEGPTLNPKPSTAVPIRLLGVQGVRVKGLAAEACAKNFLGLTTSYASNAFVSLRVRKWELQLGGVRVQSKLWEGLRLQGWGFGFRAWAGCFVFARGGKCFSILHAPCTQQML